LITDLSDTRAELESRVSLSLDLGGSCHGHHRQPTAGAGLAPGQLDSCVCVCRCGVVDGLAVRRQLMQDIADLDQRSAMSVRSLTEKVVPITGGVGGTAAATSEPREA
jgi:hypothetical protein